MRTMNECGRCHEVFMLANVPVRDTEKELNITRDQVYAKYTDGLLIEKS